MSVSNILHQISPQKTSISTFDSTKFFTGYHKSYRTFNTNFEVLYFITFVLYFWYFSNWLFECLNKFIKRLKELNRNIGESRRWRVYQATVLFDCFRDSRWVSDVVVCWLCWNEESTPSQKSSPNKKLDWEWDNVVVPNLEGWFIQPLISYWFVVYNGLIHQLYFFSHWLTLYVSWWPRTGTTFNVHFFDYNSNNWHSHFGRSEKNTNTCNCSALQSEPEGQNN